MENTEGFEGTGTKISDSAHSNTCGNTHSHRRNDRSSGTDDRPNNLDNTNACITPIDDIINSPMDEDNLARSQVSSTSQIQQHGINAADHSSSTQNQEHNGSTAIEGLSSINTDEKTTVSKSVRILPTHPEGFSCVVSMHGVVLHTDSSVTRVLGYPQDMWLGRFLIDFIHLKDRPIFSSKISSRVASAFVETSAAENSEILSRAILYCRIRKYRGMMNSGAFVFGVRERDVRYAPFQLNISFRDAAEFGDTSICLAITALPVVSPYAEGKMVCKKFTTRHTTSGIVKHLEPPALLGYLPQDIEGKSIFDFYHPDDLPYLKEVYKTVIKSQKPFRSKPYRFCAHNGDYLTIESDWSTFVNPWSKTIGFVICCHYILQAPYNTDLFQFRTKKVRIFSDVSRQSNLIQDEIIQMLTEFRQIKAASPNISASKRYENMDKFMEQLVRECEGTVKEMKVVDPEDTSLPTGKKETNDI